MAVTRVAVAAALSAAPLSSRRHRVALPSSCRLLPAAATCCNSRAPMSLQAAAAPAAGAVYEETPASSPPSGAPPPSSIILPRKIPDWAVVKPPSCSCN